jgi:hypothetical protein
VLGLILAMLAQGVRVGLSGTERYHGAVQTQSDMEPVERALRHMIERMDPGMYPDPPVVRGTANVLVFTTELPDPSTGGTLTADVRLETDDGRLALWWSPHMRGVPFDAPPPPEHEVLLEKIGGLEIGYAAKGAGAAWVSSWSQPALPGLVRLRLVPAEGGKAWPPIIARPQREQAEE